MLRQLLVSDCVLVNCSALRGGGGSAATYRNCVFNGVRNDVNKPGYAVRYAMLQGCLFTGCGEKGGIGHSTVYDSEVYSCTVMAGCASDSAGVLNESTYAALPVVNTVIMTDRANSGSYVNCVFGPKTQNTNPDAKFVDCVMATGAVVTAEGRLFAGSEAIDRGDRALLSETVETDLAGLARVMNGSLDVGAYEYDWRGDYGTALGRGVTVVDVPGSARLADDALLLKDGQLVVDWARRGEGSCSYVVEVVGTGILTVSVGGVETTYGAGDGRQVLSFDPKSDLTRLTFTYKGGTGEEDGVRLSNFRRASGTILIVM